MSAKKENVSSVRTTVKLVEAQVIATFVKLDTIWFKRKNNIQETVLNAIKIVKLALVLQETVSAARKVLS